MSDNEDISELWEDALDKYEKLAPERSRRDRNLMITLKTPEALEAHLDKSEKSFKLFRSKHGKLTSRLKACMKPFMALSSMISAAVSASGFAPASTILGAVCFVLKAAEGVTEVYEWIEQLFDKLRDFTTRLDEYVQGGLPKGFRDKVVDIFSCLLEILACAELAVKDGRWKKYAAVLFLGGDERVKAAFDKLSGLFEGEQSLVVAITYATNQKMDKRIEEIGAMGEAILNATGKAQEERARLAYLAWISDVDFAAQQSDNLGRRQRNTGEWFLQNPTFTDWASGSADPWCLFCPGAPGAGKTTMSAAVIDHLSRLGSSNDIGVGYIYCNYRSRTKQTLYNLLAGLLRRLVQIRSTVPQCIRDAYEKFHRDRKLTLDECSNLIVSVCKDIPIVYLIVDAVDESQDDVARDLFRAIRSIQKEAKIRLMMTARFIPAIAEMIEEELGICPQLEVRASDDDIRNYFATREAGFKNFLKNNSSLCKLASDRVVEASGGMFLLARLHVDQLTAMVVPAQVKNALSKMFKIPQGTSQSMNAYDEQYDLALERISNQPTYQADLARAVLAWMTFACRPLTPAELCTALAMALSEDKSELDPDYLPDVGLLVSICAGLVIIDEEANVVRPAHYTTQEYLERTHRKWFPDGQKQTAKTCTSYLSMEEFKKGADGMYDDELYYEKLATYPLLDYAARYWGKHIQPFEADMGREITALIEDFGILSNISSIAYSSRVFEYDTSWREWEFPTPMRAITTEGLSSTFEKYLKDGLAKVWPVPEEAQYTRQNTPYAPLKVAAQNGHVQLVRLFLDQPSNTGLWIGSGGALLSAVGGDHTAMVQAILGFWAENSQDKVLVDEKENILESRSSAFVHAAAYGSMDMVQLLLNTDLNNGALDRALASAASGGHERVAQLLLDRGARLNFNMADAANDGNENCVRFLLKIGSSIDYIDYRMMNVLQIASSNGSSNIVQLMIDNGADLNTYGRDRNRDTALIIAARNRQNDVVRLLLDSGAGVDLHWGGAAGNALHVAAELDFKDVCATLLAHGADVNLPSGDPECTPFETACRNGSAEVAEMLSMHGAEAPTNGISLAGAFIDFWMQSESRVKAERVLDLLNGHGVSIDFEGDGTCLPAIHEAARYGNLPVLKRLLTLGADMKSWAGEHGNILHTTVSRERYTWADVGTTETEARHAACVATLLDHGFDINSSGQVYKEALTAAIMADPRDFDPSPHPAVPLLERGIKVPDNGPELLEMAVVKGLPKVAEFLLKSGLSINTSVSYPNLLVAAVQAPSPLETAQVLVDMGADLKELGPVAFGSIFDHFNVEVLEWFLEQGVGPNTPCDNYPSRLIQIVSVPAAERNYAYTMPSKLEALIRHGADVFTYGPAALELAIANGYDEDVRRLLGEVVGEAHESEEKPGQADDGTQDEEE